MRSQILDQVRKSWKPLTVGALVAALMAGGSVAASAAPPIPDAVDAVIATGAAVAADSVQVVAGGESEALVADGVSGAAGDLEVEIVSGNSSSVDYVTASGESTPGSVYSVLQDADAPSLFHYSFEFDGVDAELVLDAETGAVQVFDAQGEFQNLVLPPWALDAEGNSVPTHYVVEGGVLTQVVDLLGSEVFPVVADPELACDALFCTVEMNKTETRDAAANTGNDALWVGGACGVIALIPGLTIPGGACAAFVAAYAGAITNASNDAIRQGKCLGLRFPLAAAVVLVPVVYSNGNCY